MRIGLDDLLMPPVVALVFLSLSWLWAKAVRRGGPLTPTQRGMLAYGFLFVLGACYVPVAVLALGIWGGGPLAAGILGWGLIVVCLAWRRHRRKTAG